MTYGVVYQHCRTLDGPASSLFDIAVSHYRSPSCTEYLTVHSRSAYPNVVSRRSPPSRLFLVLTPRLFCCIDHKRTKTYGKSRKPHTSRISRLVVSYVRLCVPFYTHNPPSFPPDEAPLLSTTLCPSPRVACFVHVGSLCDTNPLMSPTSESQVALLACTCHQSETALCCEPYELDVCVCLCVPGVSVPPTSFHRVINQYPL